MVEMVWKVGCPHRVAKFQGAGCLQAGLRPASSVVPEGVVRPLSRTVPSRSPARLGGSQLPGMPSLSPQALLPLLAKRGVVPNLQTFCNLAIGCHRPRDGLQLLADMKVSGSRPGGGVVRMVLTWGAQGESWALLNPQASAPGQPKQCAWGRGE